jgi:hypothetical protein
MYIKSINHYSLQKRFDKSSINSKKLGQQSTIYIYNKITLFLPNGYDIETLYNQKTAMEKYKKNITMFGTGNYFIN